MSEHFGSTLRVAVVGLGPIGLAAMRSILARPRTRLAAAVDIRDGLVGKDAGNLAGIGELGVQVAPTLDAAGPAGSADVVLLCTGSRIGDVADQITACLAWDASVVSSCEELSYPWFHHPNEARRIDEAAMDAGRAVIGTGVNPGFAMDTLALAVSGIAESVAAVNVHRIVDAATRRGPLQLKVGAGIRVDEFEARRAAGRIGHVGLIESAAMLGAGFGWTLESIDERLDPVIAGEDVATDVLAYTSESTRPPTAVRSSPSSSGCTSVPSIRVTRSAWNAIHPSSSLCTGCMATWPQRRSSPTRRSWRPGWSPGCAPCLTSSRWGLSHPPPAGCRLEGPTGRHCVDGIIARRLPVRHARRPSPTLADPDSEVGPTHSPPVVGRLPPGSPGSRRSQRSGRRLPLLRGGYHFAQVPLDTIRPWCDLS